MEGMALSIVTVVAFLVWGAITGLVFGLLSHEFALGMFIFGVVVLVVVLFVFAFVFGILGGFATVVFSAIAMGVGLIIGFMAGSEPAPKA